MKRLNLDETWRLELKMFKWIAKECPSTRSKIRVVDLKEKWLDKHHCKDVLENCSFCHYTKRYVLNGGFSCRSCPGSKIDTSFSCDVDKYHYQYQPKKFYEKLKNLNKTRLSKRRKKLRS